MSKDMTPHEPVLDERLMKVLLENDWHYATKSVEMGGETHVTCWYALEVDDPATGGGINFQLVRYTDPLQWMLEVGTTSQNGNYMGTICKVFLPPDEFRDGDIHTLAILIQHVKRSAMKGLTTDLFGEEG